MAGRRGRTTGQDRGRSSDPSDYYVTTESDSKYREKARARLRHQAMRRRLIGLLIVAALVAAGYLWGPDLVTAVRAKGRVTGREFKKVGDHIREGADRRGGAEFLEEDP